MNLMEIIRGYIMGRIDQGLINLNNRQNPLPDDQKQAQEDMLKALHDLITAANKVEPKYRPQVCDTCVIKFAIEMGWINNQNGGSLK